MSSLKYVDVDFDKIPDNIKSNFVLLLTVTNIETEETHNTLNPIDGYDKIVKSYQKSLTFYFGKIGGYNIVNVKSDMGSSSRSGALSTMSEVLSILETKVVIMVGIAFGVDSQKQNIGDVLLSESVIPYNLKKIASDSTIHRGQEIVSDKILFSRFKSLEQTWEHLLEGNKKAKMIPCRLLSGEELIDNIEHRNTLVKDFPLAKGGEMEGVGLSSACDGKAPWIIVKGICDFADGNKSNKKHIRQVTAIKSALSACKELFNSNSAFSEFEVHPNKPTKVEVEIEGEIIDQILFDVYNKKIEKYYIDRDIDQNFSSYIEHYNVWVFGESGVGKTNLSFRNLAIKEKNFRILNLASGIGKRVDDVFIAILDQLNQVLETSVVSLGCFDSCCKEIVSLNNKIEDEIFLVLEEIPIRSDEDYNEFKDKFFSLLISLRAIGKSKIRFVLSSIRNPKIAIDPTHKKVFENIKFIELIEWTDEDISRLIQLILINLRITISKESISYIETESKGSPRFIKNTFRDLITLQKFDDNSIKKIVNDIKLDLK